MDSSCYNSQSRGGAQAHMLEDPQILAVHKTRLSWAYFPFVSLNGAAVIPVKHRSYSSYQTLAPDESTRLVAGGPHSAKATGEPSLKKTPQPKKDKIRFLTSPSLSSLLYITTLLRAHFPQLQPLPTRHWPVGEAVVVQGSWLQSHFLRSGPLEEQQPPHLRLPLRH